MSDLDPNALAAAERALDAMIGAKPTPSILVRRSRYEIADAAISAYLSALPERDEAHANMAEAYERAGKWQARAEAAESRAAALQAEVDRLRGGLEPFARLADDYIEHGMAGNDEHPMAGRIKNLQPIGPFVTFADFRRALRFVLEARLSVNEGEKSDGR